VTKITKYTRPSRYDKELKWATWLFVDGDTQEAYIQMSDDIDNPNWERLGVELERQWLQNGKP
jgi:hemolysin-activating ACP:hemolysin acyltransferase